MNGIIIINKSKGYTSHDIVSILRKTLKIKKIGHTGTLDPSATGVLPLLIGEGTKLSKYLIEHDKEYKVTLKLGIKTDTADSEGEIVERKKVDINALELKNVINILDSFKGKQEQIPPMYSAIKVKGKKLYEYAREGKKLELKSRSIEIFDINLEKIDKKENEIVFNVHCSKGTYIRSLCEDIAIKLGSIGYMKELNRTRVGKFKIEESVTVEEFLNNTQEILEKNLITLEQFFKDNHKIKINEKQKIHFLNGVKITIKEKNGIYNIYDNQGIYMGIGVIQNNLLKREIIIV